MRGVSLREPLLDGVTGSGCSADLLPVVEGHVLSAPRRVSACLEEGFPNVFHPPVAGVVPVSAPRLPASAGRPEPRGSPKRVQPDTDLDGWEDWEEGVGFEFTAPPAVSPTRLHPRPSAAASAPDLGINASEPSTLDPLLAGVEMPDPPALRTPAAPE
jgi:hypothetical protein